MAEHTEVLEVWAPLSGQVVSLSDVPDPIFAAETVGPGFAIDPLSSKVLAPFDGVITQLHRCHHAIAVKHASGIEVLIHVGIDTVMLKGEGFSPQVQVGDPVKARQCLIELDLDKIAAKAVSLITPVLLVSEPKSLKNMTKNGSVLQAGQPFYKVALSASTHIVPHAGQVVKGSVLLRNPQGLHARPAAVLAARARSFSAHIDLSIRGQRTDARSVTGLLGLNTQWGDCLSVTAQGSDAVHALEGIIECIADGLGEAIALSAPPPQSAQMPANNLKSAKDVPNRSGVRLGVAASPGVAIGPLYQRVEWGAQFNRHGEGVDRERARFESALDTLKAELDQDGHGKAVTAQSIQRAHREMLSDPQLINAIESRLLADQSAGFAVTEALNEAMSQLRAMNNPLLAERATDLADIRNRLLVCIDPSLKAKEQKPPKGAVWIAHELTPSEVAGLKPGDVSGLISVQGGATGHVAILARALGVPAVLGVNPELLKEANGTPVLMDGAQGFVELRPDEATIKAAQQQLAERQQQQAKDAQTAHLSATTQDGVTLEIAANIQTLADAERAAHAGADGVGLLRSEFLFDGRSTAPTEAEQSSVYASIGRAMGLQRKVVMRTLDAGGDKPLAYWPMASEANPFLGIRGVRLSLKHPDQIDTQLRAMMVAATECQLHVLFPMVGLVEEIAILSQKTQSIAQECKVNVKVGVMIEVPSAALMAEQILPYVDYFSIGTNDLTQYTLAMDRGHPELAAQADAFHPAVLKLIHMTVSAAHPARKWVGVCGALAAEPLAWPLLVGLGIDELSMPSVVIAECKAAIRRLNANACQVLAQEILKLSSAADVRARLTAFQSMSDKP